MIYGIKSFHTLPGSQQQQQSFFSTLAVTRSPSHTPQKQITWCEIGDRGVIGRKPCHLDWHILSIVGEQLRSINPAHLEENGRRAPSCCENEIFHWTSSTLLFTDASSRFKLSVSSLNVVIGGGSILNCHQKTRCTEMTESQLTNCNIENDFYTGVTIL